MPIEIKELHIRAVVQDAEATQQANTTSTTEASAVQVNAIVAECVEQVLNILKEKQER
jgi:Family of unknown function (DUF5908)